MAKGMNRIYLCTIYGTILSAAQKKKKKNTHTHARTHARTHTHTHTHTHTKKIEWQGNYWITKHQFKRAAEGSHCDPISWTVPAHAWRNWGNLWETAVKTDKYPNQDSFWPTSSLDPNRQVKFNMVTFLTHHCTNYDPYNWDDCCLLSLNKQIKENFAPVPN